MSTYIPYDKLKSAGAKLKSIKNQLDNLKIEEKGKKYKKLQIYNEIPTYEDAKAACKAKSGNLRYIVTPDIKWYIDDANHNLVCKETETQEERLINKPGSLKAKRDGDKKIIYNIPSIARIGKAMGYPEYPLQYNADNIEKIRNFIENGINEYNNLVDFVQLYNKKIENLKDALETECNNISNIYTAYKDLERSAKNQFEGKKSGKKYSKTEIAKKYSALVGAAGAKNASKYLNKILKDTKSKISKSSVLSIYKNWKKSKNKKKTKNKTAASGGRTSTTMATATAATVVKTKSKKSSSNKSQTSKKKSTKNVLVGTTILASARKGIKAEIKQVKADAKTRITNARITAADEKRKLEIAKNKKIAEINRRAAEEIEAVDINDENAQQKIDEIKARAESEVNAINNQYNEDIAKIDENLSKQISDIESDRDKEVQDLNKQLDKLKSTKKANGVVEQRIVGTTLKSAAAVTVATTSNSDVAVSNEEMLNATGGLTSVYEEKSTAIQDTISAPTETNPPVVDTLVTDSTINDNPNASVTIEESVASPVSPPTEVVTEEPKTTTYETPSSNDSYVTNDGPREDIIPDNSTTQTETTKDTGFDQSNTPSGTEGIDVETNNNKEKEEDVVSITGGETEPSSKKGSSGFSTAIPIGLGVAATGAAAVAGVRYVKNRKQNEDIDETYDDENNNLEDENEYGEIPSDSAYMRDDYLGPEGSSYTEIPDENSYTDTEELEEAAGIGGFSEDAALSDLN